MDRTRRIGEADLVGMFYDAALGYRSWPEVMNGLMEHVGGETLMMSVQHPRSGQIEVLGWLGMSTDDLQRYPQFAPHDVWAIAYEEQRLFGQAAPGTRLVEERKLERSFIYNEYLRHVGVHHLAGTIVPMDGGWHAPLGMHRPRDGEAFSTAEIMRMQRLLPHVQRSLEVRRRLRQADQQDLSIQAVLERLSVGVIVLSAGGRMLLANAAAEAILRLGDGLIRTPDGLRASHRDDDRRLQRLIDGLRRGLRAASQPGGHLQVRRPSLQRAYAVMVAPGAPALEAGRGEPTILVFVSDPGAKIVSDLAVLADLFGFTPAESRLVLALISGVPLPEFARQIGVSYHTARTILARAMARTDTGSQVDLVLLVTRSLGGLAAPPAAPDGGPAAA